jgi:hypothetical protein
MSAVLTSIDQYPEEAFAGMVPGVDDGYDVESFVNNSSEQAGVSDLVFSAVNSTLYEATIYDVYVSYMSDGSATVAEIRDGMQASIAAQPGLSLKVSAVDSGSNLRITELDPEANGPMTIRDLDANTAEVVVTEHGSSEVVPAGILVARGPGYQDLRLIRADDDPMIGAVMQQHMPVSALNPDSRAGYPPMSEVSVLVKGKIWMVAEEAMALDDVVYVRFVEGAGGSQLGAIRNDDDSGTCFDASAFLRVVKSQAIAGKPTLCKINMVP